MSDKENGAMKVDVDLVRQLAELLDTTQLTEIEVEDGDRRIRVARKAAAAAAPAVYHAPPPAAAPAPSTVTAALPTAILVDNGQPVEFDQPLVVVE